MHALEAKIARDFPSQRWADLSVVVAVSGGPDSVALLRAMRALKTAGPGTLWAAHFNHELRGEESLADERFVAELCELLEIPCRFGRAERAALPLTPGHSPARGEGGLDFKTHSTAVSSRPSEATLRGQRYHFLQAVAEEVGARYVVTAHTADDQAETVLHRVIRGTGLRGLAGIRRTRPLGPAVTLVRPMLGIRRAEIVAYLEDLGQSAREDRTNREVNYTRNFIRHKLLPKLGRRLNPGVVEALVRLGSLAGEEQEVIDDLAEKLLDTSLTAISTDSFELDCRPLSGGPRFLTREALVAAWRRQGWPLAAMGYSEWDLLAQMAQAPDDTAASTRMFPGAITAQKKGERFMIARLRKV